MCIMAFFYSTAQISWYQKGEPETLAFAQAVIWNFPTISVKSLLKHMLELVLCTSVFLSKEQNILVKAYETYVWPLLEYAVCVWSPYQLEDIIKIKSVQQRFTKQFLCLSNVSYSDTLTILGLRSLQLQRFHPDLIYAYKIIFGLVDLHCSRFLIVNPNETMHGHVHKLFVSHSCVDVWKYFL